MTRSIVFTHEGATPRRMMINLSDTHVSIANLVDIDNPMQESEIEIAPYYNQIYRFGDYLVEQVQGKPENWGSPNQDLATFRVKKAGGDMENAPVLATVRGGPGLPGAEAQRQQPGAVPPAAGPAQRPGRRRVLPAHHRGAGGRHAQPGRAAHGRARSRCP